jgi:outer membrane lipopolysaccharide assembly protein LptE/RlpB
MKKMSLLLFIISMLCMLTACGESTNNTNTTQSNTSQEVTSNDESELANLSKLKELEGKNIILVDLYNEIATLAIENGWEADELTTAELGAVNTFIQLFNSVITDPTNITDADLDELLLSADTSITELDTNIRGRVSVPFSGGK